MSLKFPANLVRFKNWEILGSSNTGFEDLAAISPFRGEDTVATKCYSEVVTLKYQILSGPSIRFLKYYASLKV